MSKIKNLLKETDNVLVFDVDGVLAVQEWGEYNHFDLTDEEWAKMSLNDYHFYTEEFVSKKMQNYLKDKDMSKVFVITKSYTPNEDESKIYFCNKYYNIPKDHIFTVKSNEAKLDVLIKISKAFPNINPHKILMIEDTVSILNDIKENTNFSTIHISSFLDI